MRGLSQYEGIEVQRIRSATRDAFVNLIDRTIEQRPSFVIIAGDLYDGDWDDHNTGLFFVNQMGRLRHNEIKSFVLYGNHDAENQITRSLRLPANTIQFSSRRCETHQVDDIGVALHGRSFPNRAVTENLSHLYPSPLRDRFNIGVLHTGLGGMGGHANYAPCSIDDLVNKGYDYWALGHVHKRQLLNENPHVLFPGNLQGRHVNEIGSKSASLVSVESGAVVNIEEWECDVVRWHRIDAAVGGSQSVGQVLDAIRKSLSRLLDETNDDRIHAVRLRLSGVTPMHQQLTAASNAFTQEVRGAALDVGSSKLWVEKVEVDTRPELNTQQNDSDLETLNDVQSLLESCASSPEFLLQVENELGSLIHSLPFELQTAIKNENEGIVGIVDREEFGELVTRTKNYVMQQLRVTDDANS